MLKKIALLSIIFGLTAVQSSARWFGDSEKGSGNLKTVSFDLDEFDRVVTTGSADLHIKIGNTQKVQLTCDDNIIDNFNIEVRGKRLVIETEGSYSTRKSPLIEITVPRLEEVSLKGSGDVEVYGLDGGDLSFRLAGSGDVKAEGKVDYLELSLAGSGDINTRDLIAEEVDCRLNGSGDIRVYASQSFSGSVHGSGDITLYGDPGHVDRSISGSGSIRRR